MADIGILLVEGKDDENVVQKLCRRHGLENAFQIEECGGFEKLRESLPVRLKQSDVNVIGILVDANTDFGVTKVDYSFRSLLARAREPS